MSNDTLAAAGFASRTKTPLLHLHCPSDKEQPKRVCRGVEGGGANSPFTKKGNALSPIIKFTFPHSPKMYFPNNGNHHSLKIDFSFLHSPIIFSFSRFTTCGLLPTFNIHFHVSPNKKKYIFTFHKKNCHPSM